MATTCIEFVTGVAGETYSFSPHQVFTVSGKVPEVEQFIASGVAVRHAALPPGRVLRGELTAAVFAPRPAPAPEPVLVSEPEVRARFGWSEDQLATARAQLAFPAPAALKETGLVHVKSVAKFWRDSSIDRWVAVLESVGFTQAIEGGKK